MMSSLYLVYIMLSILSSNLSCRPNVAIPAWCNICAAKNQALDFSQLDSSVAK